jgi:hypothetical protein
VLIKRYFKKLNDIKKEQIKDLYCYLKKIAELGHYAHVKQYFTDMESRITSEEYWCINIFRDNPDIYISALNNIKDKYDFYPDMTFDLLESWTFCLNGTTSKNKYIAKLLFSGFFDNDKDNLLSYKTLILSQISYFDKKCNIKNIINILEMPDIYHWLNKKNYKKLNNLKNKYPEINQLFSKYKIERF